MVKLKYSFDYLLHLGTSDKIFSMAHSLRQEMTDAEKLLWKALRNRKLNNLKFRRQHPIGQFVADFYCHEAKLVVEVDGSIHRLANISERDEGRTFELNRKNIKVIRFTNEEIFGDINMVLEKIVQSVENISPTNTSPRPSPQGEGVAPQYIV
jgi:very-short-patch-repair endonuclease